MDSRVDFALDRTRVLAPNLGPPGALGPITSYGSDLTARVGVSDLTRTATPSTITSLAQYQSRFLPSTMSMHSPGAGFALMGGFLGGAAPGDNLKSLVPDMQQFWASHGDGYPRFVINSNPFTSAFGPFLPTADSMPPLLPPAPAGPSAADAAHCHRIYELQKDAFLASVAASQAGLYGIFPNGHPYMDHPPSPHPQPQPASLNLALVKQEPRDTSSTCLVSERPSSKAPERRIHSATPRSLETAKELPKEIHPASSGSGSRSQSAHRSSSNSRVHQKTADKKNNPPKVSVVEDVPCTDRRKEPSAKAPEKRSEPQVKTVAREVHASKGSEASSKNTNTQAKPSKTPCDVSVTHKTSGSQVSKTSKAAQQPSVPKITPLQSEKTNGAAHSKNVVVSNNSASGQVKENKDKTRSSEGGHSVEHSQRGDVTKKGAGSAPATSLSSSGEAGGEKPRKKKPREKSDSKHGVHAGITMDEGSHPSAPSGGSDDVSSKQPTSIPASGTPSGSTTSVISTATPSQPKASGCEGNGSSTSSFSPVPQPVPTLSTVTSTPSDANVVTSVSVTSGGTQSVFTRSQPVVSSVAAAKAASPMQLSSSSVTSQVATSALPYYHTLYSKAEGDGQGAGAVKRVHATTTFVPEVGTFKGPLIRNMSKGCLEPRVKSEHPRSSCCQEGDGAGGKTVGGRGDEGSSDGSERAGSGHEIGSEDEPSDLSTSSSSHRQQRHGVEDDPSEAVSRQMRISSPTAEGRTGGLSCSSRSSVSYHGSGTVPYHAANPAGVANVSEVALDFSISKRTKDSSGDAKHAGRKEQPQAKISTRTHTSASVSNRPRASLSIHGASGPVADNATAFAPKHQKSAGHSEAVYSSSIPSSSFVPHPAQDPARQPATSSSLYPGKPGLTASTETHVLNLSRSATNRTLDQDPGNAKKHTAPGSSGGSAGGETVYRVASRVRKIGQLVAGEKRCGSAPPRSSVPETGGQAGTGVTETRERERDYVEEEEEEDIDSSESPQVPDDKGEVAEPVASNIPVGIAVAQQRPDAGRADARPGASRAEDSDASRQLGHDFTEREDFLRQQKAVLTGAAKPIPNTGLPPNLVVTGGDNTLSEDLRLRPLANQWLGHGIAPSAWLPQNPFTIHPAIPTSTAAFDPSHLPVTIPSGFKLAQDSLTGQLLIIPSGELVDQNALWSAFQSSAGTQPVPPPFPHIPVPLSQHAPVSAAPPGDSDEHAQTGAGGTEEQTQTVEESDPGEDESADGLQASENGARPSSRSAPFSKDKPSPATTAVTINNNNVLDNREKGEAVGLNTFVPTPADLAAQSLAFPYQAAAAAGLPGAQFPFVFNPALLPLPPGLPVGEPLSIKTESPSVQSRGTSPIVLTPPPSDDTSKGGVKETGSDPKTQVRKVCVSVQTGSDLDPNTEPTRKVNSKEQGIQTCQEERLEPLSVICGTSDFAMPASLAQSHSELFARHRVSAPFGSVAALAAAAMVAEGHIDLTATSSVCGRGHGPGYNPFTDPQILQAADGLELLSTLAEKRPKCSSALVDPKAVFPSPSDSFKSDTPLPCVELDDSASVGEEERSGQTTPRTDRPRDRDLSPKWGVVRKEFGPPTTTSECTFTTSLANMDAMELDMRIRLAELQRQYREKQRELAKLGPKKEKDDGVKRGRGRPRKRQFVNKKYDDDSSNSSGGKAAKEAPVKRKRPAEELVDRVFRKLPPAKVGKLKSVSLKHKRRPSHSTTTSSDADTSREAGKKKDKHRHGNLFANLESSFGESCSKKKSKKETDIPATATSALPSVATTISPVTLESGLNILAKFATSALSSTSFPGIKRKSEDSPWDHGSADTHLTASAGHSPSNKRRESDTDNSDTANGTCIKKRKPGRPRKCDPNKTTGFTETIWARQTGLLQLSDVAQGKSWVSKAEEAATSSTVTTSTASATTGSKLSAAASSHGPASQAPLAPLMLDEWSLRRSERIFLSDTSPLPSPNLQQAKDGSSVKAPGARDCRSSSAGGGSSGGGGGGGGGGGKGSGRVGRPPGSGNKQRRNSSVSSDKVRQRSNSNSASTSTSTSTKISTTATITVTTAPAFKARQDSSTSGTSKVKTKVKDEKRDRDHAKVQKARSLQELTQRVKRKYSKSLCKKPASDDRLQKKTQKEDIKKTQQIRKTGEQESDSSSEGDNIPLSSLRERPSTPEPRSCIIRQEELREGLHVLLFRDSLFYEGVVQAIQPPDIYGVVVTGQRGNRPHIYSREEILKDAIMAVPPGSQRYVTEGTRVCAYWSQQFRCLYPGTVAKTSPNPHAESSVNVEFDDGDSGRIPINHIRLLPPDFPLVTEEELNPLLFPTKRRRNTTSDDDFRKASEGPHHSSAASDSCSARRDFRSRTADDNNSDDGEVFENLPQKSGAEKDGKAASRAKSQTSSGQDEHKEEEKKKVKKEVGSKDKRPTPIIRPASFNPKKSSSRKKGDEDKDYAAEEDSDEDSDDDSEDESEDDSDDYSSSEDKKKSNKSDKAKNKPRKGAPDAKKSKRGRKKKKSEDLPAFMTPRPLWRWAGRSTKRPGMRGKAKKEFYRSIVRGSDHIMVGDSAVFLSTGRDHCPYIGRIESLWAGWGGQMTVKVKWFYHPEETKGGKTLSHPKGALFESPHGDENDVQTISHKCHVLPHREYMRRAAEATRKGQTLDPNIYYQAGYYDPTIGHMRLYPDVQ